MKGVDWEVDGVGVQDSVGIVEIEGRVEFLQGIVARMNSFTRYSGHFVLQLVTSSSWMIVGQPSTSPLASSLAQLKGMTSGVSLESGDTIQLSCH